MHNNQKFPEADLKKRALSAAYIRGPLVSILVNPSKKKKGFSSLLSRLTCHWGRSTYLRTFTCFGGTLIYLVGALQTIFLWGPCQQLLTLLTLKSATGNSLASIRDLKAFSQISNRGCSQNCGRSFLHLFVAFLQKNL